MMTFMIEQYHEVEAYLQELSSQYSASECQGVMCGALVLDGPSPLIRWIDELVEELDIPIGYGQEIRQILTELAALTQQRLNDPGISFRLLLPDEDQTSLAHRAEALSEWCQGFLYGLSLAGVNNKSLLPKDSVEFIGDILEISRVVVDTDSGEADEMSYVELVEYLRVGVLLLLEETQSQDRNKRV
jgi:uncharacterized protein YgfB (UPF0149 family)